MDDSIQKLKFYVFVKYLKHCRGIIYFCAILKSRFLCFIIPVVLAIVFVNISLLCVAFR